MGFGCNLVGFAIVPGFPVYNARSALHQKVNLSRFGFAFLVVKDRLTLFKLQISHVRYKGKTEWDAIFPVRKTLLPLFRALIDR